MFSENNRRRNKQIAIIVLVAFTIPAAIWLIDAGMPQSGWLPHIVGALALWILFPTLWLIGNFIGLLLVWRDGPERDKPGMFYVQLLGSVIILLAGLFFWGKSLYEDRQNELRWKTRESIRTGNVDLFKQAVKKCGSDCRDEYVDWVSLATAAGSLQILDHLLNNPPRGSTPDDFSGYGYRGRIDLGDSCRGYFVGEADIYQLAVLQNNPGVLKRLLQMSSIDQKNAVLWYAARTNKLDYLQIALAAGASRDIKSRYGHEKTGTSLVNAAVEGTAPETLAWLLKNGFDPNGPVGEGETARSKRTPLHDWVSAADQEKQQAGNLRYSLQTLDLLLRSGANPDIPDPHRDNRTPLQQAIYLRSHMALEALLRSGGSLDHLSADERKSAEELLTEMKSARWQESRQFRQQNSAEDNHCAERRLKEDYGIQADISSN